MIRRQQKYSIVIPTLTRTQEHKKVLEETLSTVGVANSLGCETILIDDGSTEDISDLYPQVHKIIIHRKNQGIAPSWNDGIKIANGDYVVVINDDITVEIGWLDKLRQALEDEDENMVSAPGVIGKQNGVGIEQDYLWFPGYCFMLSRKTIDTIGLFDEQFVPFNFEDTDYWTRVLDSGGKLVRNYNTTIKHHEGHVLHTLNYDDVSEENKKKFIAKHGFDPIPVFYHGQSHDWKHTFY